LITPLVCRGHASGVFVFGELCSLLKMAGIVGSTLTDIAEHHDRYIGQALAEKITHRGGA
jgi:hypothetical protein